MNAADRVGAGDAERRFSVVTFVSLALLAGLFALAVARVRRPDVHKRLMVLVMVVLVQPATARIFALVLGKIRSEESRQVTLVSESPALQGRLAARLGLH
jgi:integral membrane sensor domain MASE1